MMIADGQGADSIVQNVEIGKHMGAQSIARIVGKRWNRRKKKMTSITVYDDTAKKIEQVAEKHDTSVAEVVNALMDFIDELED